MIILSPCDRRTEVEPLIDAGAGELYGGVQPDGWAGRFLSANQRTFPSAHFEAEAEFAEAVGAARRLGVPFHLVLNAPLYDPDSYGALTALATRAVGWGVRGVIVGDLGLLLRLRGAALPLELTLSTLAGALNAETAGFYQELGAHRIVLPRHLTLTEMGQVVAALPETAFEVFVLIGKCPNEEAWCSFQHVSPAQRWPCEISYALESARGEPLPPHHPLSRWHGSWREVDRRQACGLCAIGELRRLGIRHLKLVGRGGPTAGKIANVRLVARCVGSDRTADANRAEYEERFGHPCHPLICYFPELHPRKEAESV